jgi:hypothetical protein
MAGFLVLQNDVLFSTLFDDHGKMLIENGIAEDKHDWTNFVRARLVPPDHDYRYPFNQWFYYENQKILPDWYSQAYCEAVCRDLLPLWFPYHVFIDAKTTLERAESIFVYGNSRIRINRVTGGRICVYGNSILEIDELVDGNIMARENSRLDITKMLGGDPESHEQAKVIIKKIFAGDVWEYGEFKAAIREKHGGYLNGKRSI